MCHDPTTPTPCARAPAGVAEGVICPEPGARLRPGVGGQLGSWQPDGGQVDRRVCALVYPSGDPMSEAAFDHAIGTAEDVLPADVTGPLVGGRLESPTEPTPEPTIRVPHAEDRPAACGQCIAASCRRSSAGSGTCSRGRCPSCCMKTWFRVTIVGRDRIGSEPAMYVFNHLSWMDPLALLATFPSQPRLHFFGPKEVDPPEGPPQPIHVVDDDPDPVQPHKDDLLTSVRRAQAVFDSGASLAISAEGRSTSTRATSCRSRRVRPTSRSGPGSRSCRSRSRARPGRTSAAACWSASASRSRRAGARRGTSSRATRRSPGTAPSDGRRRPGPAGPGQRDQSLVHRPVQRLGTGRPARRDQAVRPGSRGRPDPATADG